MYVDMCDCQNVMKALHCYKPVDRQSKLVHLLASMCTYEILFNAKETTDSAADEDVADADTLSTKPVRFSRAHSGCSGPVGRVSDS